MKKGFEDFEKKNGGVVEYPVEKTGETGLAVVVSHVAADKRHVDGDLNTD